jgi:hypothetical protein
MDSTETTIQLRRYQIEPGRMADHLAWFPTIRAARERFGFRVLFALADFDKSIFTWAVSVPGDRVQFAAVDAAWMVSPGRAAAFETNPKAVTSMETDIVTDATLAPVTPV